MTSQTKETGAKKLAVSAVNNEDGLSSTDKGALAEFVIAAKKLVCDHNIDHILGHFDKVADMKEDIKSKVEKIETLEAEARRQTENHKISQQESLSAYTHALDKIRAELGNLQKNVASLQSEVDQRDETIETYRKENASLTGKLQKSTEKSKELEETASKNSAKAKDLERSLEETKVANETSLTALKQHEAKLSELHAELRRRQSENEI